MKEVLIIGSGISGLACAIRCASHGMHVTLASPFVSERSQSVMASGGINAVISECEKGDSVMCHIEDTLKGGCDIAGIQAVTGLCESAEGIIRYLESIGTVFSQYKQDRPLRRAFGGQSHKRTYFCGSSTGKQIVSALVMEARRYEAAGLITRKLHRCFHSALIKDGICYGALLFDEGTYNLEAVYADAVVMATGGQNALFSRTTGSTQCDGYAAGKLFMQGAVLKNLEFIQYHPTTLETPQKRMLVSEAARGEGGRLFYYDNDKRIYFMEDRYGPDGNLMTRDIVSREIWSAPSQVYLDVSFLDRNVIDERLSEVRDICMKYRGIDIAKDPVPVEPSVHFFMGGLAVHLNHETNLHNLFAVGECASMYHGANRLGGNSLLAAICSGNTAADEISARPAQEHPDFSCELDHERSLLKNRQNTESSFPVMYIHGLMAETMDKKMGIVRCEEGLDEGIQDIDYYLSAAEKINYDSSVLPYFNYSLTGILTLARASLSCAKVRRESRGAHYRSDYPETDAEHAYASLISYDGGEYNVRADQEREYES